jgi:23S rRNA pseudouridine2604 synthase
MPYLCTVSSIRLNKFISESGVCSRREADRFIEQGNVTINGKRAKIGDQVNPGDLVRVNGNALEPVAAIEHVYIALNKPPGITSTTEEEDRTNIVDFVNHSRRVFPVGRLDKDSQGLIFLTSDGNIVNKILRASNNHEKEYLVTVDKPITDEFITGMSAGVPILGQRTKKCFIQKETPFIFRIILVQGLNRQIRRMCEFFGYNVVKLERIRIMNVTLKGLPQGDWRDLTAEELKGIFKMIEQSSGEPEKEKVFWNGKKRRETGEKSREMGDGRREKREAEDGRGKTGEGRRETRDGKRKTEYGKRKTGSGKGGSGKTEKRSFSGRTDKKRSGPPGKSGGRNRGRR